MNEEIVGYWHKMPCRCDYCHRAVQQIYLVKDGPTTGKFCSRQHYEAAKKEMNNENEI